MPISDKLLDIVTRESSNLKTVDIFIVRDFFKGYKWNHISRRCRLLIVTLFRNYVKIKNINVITIEKTSSSQQKYRRNSVVR